MTRTTINVSAKPRPASGSARLARNIASIRDSMDSMTRDLKRIDAGLTRAGTVSRAVDILYRPTPEQRAVRDRAAFEQGMRDRVERQRDQLRTQQQRANEFYGRTA